MFRFVFSILSLFALLGTTSSLLAQDNPFKKAEVGDWVSYEMKVDAGGQTFTTTMKQTLKEKTTKEATVAVEVTAQGRTFNQEQKIPLDKPYDPAEMAKQQGGGQADVKKMGEGKDTIEVGGKKYNCTWMQLKVTVKQFNLETTSKVWMSSEVPLSGLVKMETDIMGRKMVMEMTGHGKAK